MFLIYFFQESTADELRELRKGYLEQMTYLPLRHKLFDLTLLQTAIAIHDVSEVINWTRFFSAYHTSR